MSTLQSLTWAGGSRSPPLGFPSLVSSEACSPRVAEPCRTYSCQALTFECGDSDAIVQSMHKDL